MQNEAVAPTIPFTIVHGNTELCCVIKHCLKITNVKNQMRMNAYVLIRPTGISVQDLVSAPRCQGNIFRENVRIGQTERAEKLTSDFEKSCANPKIDQKSYANIATKIGSGGWVKTTCLRLCEENDSSPYQNETLKLQ